MGNLRRFQFRELKCSHKQLHKQVLATSSDLGQFSALVQFSANCLIYLTVFRLLTARISGHVYIPRGVSAPALDKDILWEFQPKKVREILLQVDKKKHVNGYFAKDLEGICATTNTV